MSRRGRIGAVLALSSLVLVADKAGTAPSDGPPLSAKPAVAVVKASQRCFTSVVNATGYIVPKASAVVLFNAPGFRFSDVRVQEGDSVRRGDVVATADALADMPGAGAAAKRIAIKSPAAGVILRRQVEPGDVSSPVAQPLFTVAVDGEMEAAVDIPSVHAFEIEVGQVARLSLEGAADLDARVRAVPAEIKPQTQVGQARLSIQGGSPPMMGRFVRASIDARRSCGVAVPISALTHASDGIRLQILKGDVIETRHVTIGLRGDAYSEVTAGIAEGDVVIADAGTSLEDGDQVRRIFSDSEEAR